MTTDEPQPPAPSAPPTRPGKVRRITRPFDGMAILALVLGVVGMVLVPVAIAGIVLGIVAIRRVRRSAGTTQGTGLAVAGICCGGFGILATFLYAIVALGMFQTVGQTRMMVQGTALRQVHRAASSWASTHGGAYPEHVALLATGPTPTAVHGIVDLHGVSSDPVTVGTFDFTDYDGGPAAQDRIIEAVAALPKDRAWYQFGLACFVRLDRPVGDPDLVFAWMHAPGSGFVWFVTDDGRRNALPIGEWDDAWDRDAAARTRRGLPAFRPPALE